jgi:RNA polymerase sigma-70 factor, ECF subfamily
MASNEDSPCKENLSRASNEDATPRTEGGHDEKSYRFISLFAKNQYAVHGYIRALVPNRADAEDIMQEVSYTLWNKWHTFDPATDFIRWACAVAFIEILRYRRKSAKDRLWFNEPLMELLAADFRRNAEMYSARLDALVSCLEKLDPQDRRLVEVRYRLGGSVRRIADDLDTPLSTVYKKLNRIRGSLRRCIDHTLATQSHPPLPQS